MRAKIARWGNSLALRVPRHLAAEAGLQEGTVVELTAGVGSLAILALPPRVPPLGELLAQITEDNQHPAADCGPAVGTEAW